MAETKAPEAPKQAAKSADDETAVVTARDGSEVTVQTLPPAEADVRNQFGNNSDWPLFQRNDFVRAKPIEPEQTKEGEEPKRKYQVFDRDGNESQVDAEQFEAEYSVVKGPHKQEF